MMKTFGTNERDVSAHGPTAMAKSLKEPKKVHVHEWTKVRTMVSAVGATAALTKFSIGLSTCRKGTFPAGRDLKGLPIGVIESVELAAAQSIHRLVFPRLLLRKLKKQRHEQVEMRFVVRDPLKVMPLLRLRDACSLVTPIPDDQLREILRGCRPDCFSSGEVLCYQGVPVPCTPIFFLVNGSCLVYSQGKPTTITAPYAIGAQSVIEGVPSSVRIVAVGNVDVLVTYGRKLLSLLHSSVQGVATGVSEEAFLERKAEFEASARLDPEVLRTKSVLFRDWPNGDLLIAISKFVPVSLRNGARLVKPHTQPRSIVYVTDGSLIAGEVSLGSSNLWFEKEIFLSQQLHYSNSVVAAKSTNIWELKKSDAMKLLSEERLRKLSKESLRRHICDSLSRNDTAASKIKDIPIYCRVLGQKGYRKLLNAMTPVVYFPGEVICSRADYCESMSVLVKGNARIYADETLYIAEGEAIGYSVLAYRKWLYTVVAETLVETFSISRTGIIQLVKSLPDGTEIGRDLLRKTHILVSPSQHSTDELQSIAEHVSGLRTIPLFPLDEPGTRPTTEKLEVSRKDNDNALLAKYFTSLPIPRATAEGRSNLFYKSKQPIRGIVAYSDLFSNSSKPQPPKSPQSPTARTRKLKFTRTYKETDDILRAKDEIVADHRQRVDHLWTASKVAKRRVERLYPPVKSKDGSFLRDRTSSMSSVVSHQSSSSDAPQGHAMAPHLSLPL